MAFKYLALAALVAVAQSAIIPTAYSGYVHAPVATHVVHTPIVHAPVAYAHHAEVVDAANYDPHPEYSFSYDVHDPITGDSKTQTETRSGDVVQGSYSVDDPDGTHRVVEYTADDVNGFNAVVRKEAGAAVAAHVATPVIAAKVAPIVHKVVSPLAYSSPAVYGGYSGYAGYHPVAAYKSGYLASPSYVHGYAAPRVYSTPVVHHATYY